MTPPFRRSVTGSRRKFNAVTSPSPFLSSFGPLVGQFVAGLVLDAGPRPETHFSGEALLDLAACYRIFDHLGWS